MYFSIVGYPAQFVKLRCFLAVKHASLAMLKVNPSVGKELTGGSIILTASGRFP